VRSGKQEPSREKGAEKRNPAPCVIKLLLVLLLVQVLVLLLILVSHRLLYGLALYRGGQVPDAATAHGELWVPLSCKPLQVKMLLLLVLLLLLLPLLLLLLLPLLLLLLLPLLLVLTSLLQAAAAVQEVTAWLPAARVGRSRGT